MGQFSELVPLFVGVSIPSGSEMECCSCPTACHPTICTATSSFLGELCSKTCLPEWIALFTRRLGPFSSGLLWPRANPELGDHFDWSMRIEKRLYSIFAILSVFASFPAASVESVEQSIAFLHTEQETVMTNKLSEGTSLVTTLGVPGKRKSTGLWETS